MPAHRYKCDECGTRFTQAGALQQHRSTHSKVKSEVCNLCGRGFARKASLRRHMQVHNKSLGNLAVAAALIGRA